MTKPYAKYKIREGDTIQRITDLFCVEEATWLKYHNKAIFDCPGKHTAPRFHWSSCVYIEMPEEKKKKDSGEKFPGFKGKMAVYTSGGKVENGVTISNDANYKEFTKFCDDYPSPNSYASNSNATANNLENETENNPNREIAASNRWWNDFNRLHGRLKYSNTKSDILCRYYTDEKPTKKTIE